MSERNTVKFKLDPNSPQTSQQRERLRQVVAMPDAQIDYSDDDNDGHNDTAPTTGAIQWTRPGALISPENKQQVTLRLDAVVLNF